MGVLHIDKGEAEAAIRAAAFEDDGRLLVHCFIGAIGADWDVEDVLTALTEASEVAWASNILRHDLAMRSPAGKVYRFAVQAPEGTL